MREQIDTLSNPETRRNLLNKHLCEVLRGGSDGQPYYSIMGLMGLNFYELMDKIVMGAGSLFSPEFKKLSLIAKAVGLDNYQRNKAFEGVTVGQLEAIVSAVAGDVSLPIYRLTWKEQINIDINMERAAQQLKSEAE